MFRFLGRFLMVCLVLCGVGYAAVELSPWPSALFYRYLFDRGGVAMNEALARHVPSGVSTRSGIAYGTDPIETLDLHLPAGAESAGRAYPVIVWIHGGASCPATRGRLPTI